MRFRLLGSGVLRPLEHRYLTSVYMQYESHRYLFDCPENTQTQLQKFGEKLDLDAIFLTDVRPGETFGLPGLLTTLNFLSKDNENLSDIEIYLPANDGAEQRIERLISLSTLDAKFHLIHPGEEIVESENHSVLAFETNPDHKGTSLGYRLQEAKQPGRFNRERAEELGIEPGPKFGRLHDGESVELDDGRIIHPDEVVGDQRPGRSIVYTGESGLFNEVPELICDADVAILDGGSSNEHGDRFRQKHMTAYDAGTLAGATEASLAVLTYIRDDRKDNLLIEELTDAFNGPYIIGEDGVAGRVKPHEASERSVSHVRDVLLELKNYSRMSSI